MNCHLVIVRSNFNELYLQNCSDLILYVDWKREYGHTFYDAYLTATDYGVCCLIIPWLDFENPSTKDKPPSEFTGEDYHNIKRGVKNGLQNGLKLIVDMEGWDYGYFSRGAKGLRLVLGDARDKMVVNQVKKSIN